MPNQPRPMPGAIYSAEFGPEGKTSPYRYKLSRYWRDLYSDHLGADRYALFIMLNPSTADADKDDPTVAKCMRLARRWGAAGVEVRNIFAIRGTDPAIIRVAPEPVGGARNDLAILEAALHPRCGAIVAAWGNHGSQLKRSSEVKRMLQGAGKPVYVFALSKTGEPVHPLYQKECEFGGLLRWL